MLRIVSKLRILEIWRNRTFSRTRFADKMFLQKSGGGAPVLATRAFLGHVISGCHLVFLPLPLFPGRYLPPSLWGCPWTFAHSCIIHSSPCSLSAYVLICNTGLRAIEDFNSNNHNSNSNNVVLPVCQALFEVLYKCELI